MDCDQDNNVNWLEWSFVSNFKNILLFVVVIFNLVHDVKAIFHLP